MPTVRDRVSPREAWLVLAVLYLGLAVLYGWQASHRLSPTIFVDEIELTQISRSIADTGEPARRGVPFSHQTLYSYLLAPAWWIEDTRQAWDAIKLLGVLVMTATIFPAYALASYVVGRAWAVAAAAASVAAPPLAYAPYLMQEPLAYPVATVGLWAIAAYVAEPGRLRLAVALAAAFVAYEVRDQLAVLAAILVAGAAYHGWRTDRFRAWRATWITSDWIGFGVLLLGVALAASAAAGRRSERWYVTTGFLKQKLLDHGMWAIAAAGVGVGILPLVAGLAVLASPRCHTSARARAFVVTGTAAVVCFTAYAALKGAYVSTVLGPLVVERNVIYVVPVLFAATAAAVAYARFTVVALASAAVAVFVLIWKLELQLDKYPYFEAPGLAVGQLANRIWYLDGSDVRLALFVTLAIAVALLALRRASVPSRYAHPFAGAVVAIVAAWSLTTQVYAARGLNDFSERLYEATPDPPDWVDRDTGGEAALYLGQRERDPNDVWLLEFWNRSVKEVWSVDGSAPAPTQTPDVADATGTLSADPGFEWVVARDGVALAGERIVSSGRGMTLYRAERPLRLRFTQQGVEPDGWSGSRASYSHFTLEAGRRGFARIQISREGACGDAFPTSTVEVRVGPLGFDQYGQPSFREVAHVERFRLTPCSARTIVTRASVPFHVDVTVDPTFVPRELDPSSPDPRELGAQVGFGFIPIG